ncbi:MAG: hypothetical protein ACFFAH_02730 [Promethearchaeota archaeon]
MIYGIFIIYHGMCLFSRQYGKKYIDDQLFPSLFAAINQFAKEISKEHLKKIIIGDDIFSFSGNGDLLFVYRYDETNEYNFKRISNELNEKFLELFKPELKNWNGEITQFYSFEKEADKILSMKGQSIGIDLDKLLKEDKIKSSAKKEKKLMKGQLTLIEIEKFLQKKKIERSLRNEKMVKSGQLNLIEIENSLQQKNKDFNKINQIEN